MKSKQYSANSILYIQLLFSYTIQSDYYSDQFLRRMRENVIYSMSRQEVELPEQKDQRHLDATKDNIKPEEEQSELCQLVNSSLRKENKSTREIEGAQKYCLF